jgi:hypothetical protein
MQARKAALLSSPFLWLIGVTLFLPTVRACEDVVSPAQLIHDKPLPFALMLSPFCCGELLAILLLVPLLRRVEPSRRWWLAALATVLPVFASPSLFVYSFSTIRTCVSASSSSAGARSSRSCSRRCSSSTAGSQGAGRA